ncbi:unnamed protein product [Prunus armeniaca]
MASFVKARGSWTTLEDIALCQSWVNISHSPITGNEMKFSHMWNKIHGEFCQRSGSILSEMALSSRWRVERRGREEEVVQELRERALLA